jgi:hypothetical protein
MNTELLCRLPVEQARCRELARQFMQMGSIGCFAAALIEEALQRADRAIIEGCESAVRETLRDMEAFQLAPPAASQPAPQAMRQTAPTLAAVPGVGRRPARASQAMAA